VFKDGTELQVFVAEVKRQIVGVAVIRCEEVGSLLSDVHSLIIRFLLVMNSQFDTVGSVYL